MISGYLEGQEPHVFLIKVESMGFITPYHGGNVTGNFQTPGQKFSFGVPKRFVHICSDFFSNWSYYTRGSGQNVTSQSSPEFVWFPFLLFQNWFWTSSSPLAGQDRQTPKSLGMLSIPEMPATGETGAGPLMSGSAGKQCSMRQKPSTKGKNINTASVDLASGDGGDDLLAAKKQRTGSLDK